MITGKEFGREAARIRREARTLPIRTGFTFNGRSSPEFHLNVEQLPTQHTPRRRRETVKVPGRSGDLHFTEDSYENFQMRYLCYFHGEEPMPELAAKIKEWLLSPAGYCKLSDAYADGYHMATFTGPMDIENTLNRYGRCVVTFDCAPQCWSDDSFAVMHITKPTTIHGNGYPWNPVLTVFGTGAGTVMVGNITIDITDISGSVTLDCDAGDAYRMGNGVKTNANMHVLAQEYPVIIGETPISWTGGVTKIDLIPRSWKA